MRRFTADEEGMKEYNGIVQRLSRLRFEYDNTMQQLAAWEQAHGEEIPDPAAPEPEASSEEQPPQ